MLEVFALNFVICLNHKVYVYEASLEKNNKNNVDTGSR